MSLTLPVLVLLIPAIVWLVVSLINNAPRTATFWFEMVVIAAILLTFGLLHN